MERSSDAWTPDTLAGRRFVSSAMISAHEVTGILGKKLIVDPIQRNADVTAAVEVSKMFSLEVDQHRFHAVFPASQHELLAFPVSELAQPRDKFFSRASFMLR